MLIFFNGEHCHFVWDVSYCYKSNILTVLNLLSQVPLVTNEDVQTFEVEVRGNTFHSVEARKVMIKAYKPKTFIQTDKPIYLPGQTGNGENFICINIPVRQTNSFCQAQLVIHVVSCLSFVY